MCAALPRLPPTVEISPGGADTPGGGCTPTRQYTPSAWEREWRLNISSFADSIMWKRGCEQLKRQEPSVKAWLASWSQHETGVKGDLDAALFSYHTLHTCVNGETRSVRVPIEPLVGLLRHPKYYCLVPGFSGKVPPTFLQGTFYKHNRDYLLPFWRKETLPRPGRRSHFFDLGASLYTAGIGGASQKWFVDTYAKRGIDFDRIFACERTNHSDKAILSRLIGRRSH